MKDARAAEGRFMPQRDAPTAVFRHFLSVGVLRPGCQPRVFSTLRAFVSSAPKMPKL